MTDQHSAHQNGRKSTVLGGLIALLLAGCQATLFTAINATSGDDRLDVHSGIVFDASHQLALDVYAPRGAQNAPVVVFYYGGGWDSGKRQWYQWLGETLARHGVVTVIPDYRKYPQVELEGFMTDTANALAWVNQHIAGFGGDAERIFLMGHSAGAHLAALLAVDGRWLKAVGMQPQNLAGFIGLAGPYDFLPLTDADFIAMFGDDTASQRLSQPALLVDGGEPPMLLLHGLDDDTVIPRNSRSLAQAVRSHGGSVELHLYPDVGHAGLLLSLSSPFRSKAPALPAILDFIKQHE